MTKIKEKEAEFIASHYKGVSTRKMVPLLYEATGTKVGKSTIMAYYKKMGYCSGVSGNFKKGYEGLTDEQKARIQATQFKNNHKPPNKKQIGTVSYRSDGYVYVKTDEDKWEKRYNADWKKANGEIPKGYRLLHLDRNKANDDLSNLMLMSDMENITINGIGLTKDAETNKAILLTTRLRNLVKGKYGEDN